MSMHTHAWRAKLQHLLHYMSGMCLICLAATSSAWAAHSYVLAGQWNCTTSPVRLPAQKGLPALTLHQRSAFSANAYGIWASNSVLDFASDKGERYRLQATAKGHSIQKGTIIQQSLQSYQILTPFDKSSAFAQAHGSRLNAILLAATQRQRLSSYYLTEISPTNFVIRMLKPKGQRSSVKISCLRANS